MTVNYTRIMEAGGDYTQMDYIVGGLRGAADPGGGAPRRGAPHRHHRGHLPPVLLFRGLFPRVPCPPRLLAQPDRLAHVLHDGGDPRHSAGGVRLVHLSVHPLRGFSGKDGDRQALHRHRRRHRRLGRRRTRQGGRDHERPGGDRLRELRRQHRRIGQLHHPDDEEARVPAGIRRCGRSRRLDGRSDHAPRHGRRGLPDGRIHQHPLHRNRQGRRHSGLSLFFRHLHRGPLRGQTVRPQGDEPRPVAQIHGGPAEAGPPLPPAGRDHLRPGRGVYAQLSRPS